MPFTINVDVGAQRRNKEIEAGLRQAAKDAYGIDIPPDIKGAEGVANYLATIGPSKLAEQKQTLESVMKRNEAAGQARGLTETALPTLQSALERYHPPDVTRRALSSIPATGGPSGTGAFRPNGSEAGQMTLARALQASGQPLTQEGFTSAVAPKLSQNKVDTNLSSLDLVAREFGLTNASEATPEQAKSINALAQERAAALSGQRAGAVETQRTSVKRAFKLNEQLSVDDAIKLGVPYGSKVKDAIGRQPMTTQQRETLNDFAAAETIVEDISALSEKVNTWNHGPLGLGRLAGAAANTWGAITQTNTEAAILATKVGELSLLVRGMGEKGTLATQDVERVAKLVPNNTDSKPVAREKVKQLLSFISKINEKRVESFVSDLSSSQSKNIPSTETPKTADEFWKKYGGK